MINEDIRELVRKRPFQPFDLVLVDGQRLAVVNPDFVLVPRERHRVIMMYDADETPRLLNPSLILSIEPHATSGDPNAPHAPNGNN